MYGESIPVFQDEEEEDEVEIESGLHRLTLMKEVNERETFEWV